MTEEADICMKCKFWERAIVRGLGYCHRYAPSAVSWRLMAVASAREMEVCVDDMQAEFPVTNESEWCGDYKAKGQPVSEPPPK